MAKFCVCVTFRIAPEHHAAFVDLVRDQARNSLTEAGCEVFDVWTDPDRTARVFLYEVYSDEAAFDMHVKMPYFQRFDEAIKDMVVEKEVLTWAKSENDHD